MTLLIFPEVSRDRATSVCVPFEDTVVFHETAYGEVVSSTPTVAPSTKNVTPATATLSLDVALIFVVPLNVELATGTHNITSGAIVSGRFTENETGSASVPGIFE
jgi:hypothetical protein